MRSLIDEMFPPVIARQLQEQHGVDAAAVADDPALSGQSDTDVFRAAQDAGRTIVTENVPDFRRLGLHWQATGQVHHGLVLTTNRRYPRHRPGTVGRLVRDLARLAATTPPDTPPSNLELWL